MRPDLRVVKGGKTSHDEALELAFTDGEWRLAKRVQQEWLASSRGFTVRDWRHALDFQYDRILQHSEHLDNDRDRAHLEEWLLTIAGTALAWHRTLQGDTEGAA